MARLHFAQLRRGGAASRTRRLTAAIPLAAALLLSAAVPVGAQSAASIDGRGPQRGFAARPVYARAGLGTPEPQAGAAMAAEYQQLARPELVRAAAVHNLELDWHGLRFLLLDGELALGAPAAGHVTTAVFAGQGAVALAEVSQPPWRQAIESGQAERFMGRSRFGGSISQAVFRFADAAAFTQALHPQAQFAAGADMGRVRGALDDDAKEIEKLGEPTVARIWRGLDDDEAALLLSEVKLDNAGWISMDFDPTQAEPLRVAGDVVVTQYAPPGEAAPVPGVQLGPYELKATIAGNLDLEVQARIGLSGGSGRGVLLSLNPQLRVTEVNGAGAGAEFYQPEHSDWLYLRLGQPLGPGQSASVELHYQGKGALQPALTAHDWIAPADWYPALMQDGPLPLVRFDLQVTADKKYQVLATPSGTLARSAGFTAGEDEESQRPMVTAGGKALEIRVTAPRDEDPKAMMALGGSKLADIVSYMNAAEGPYGEAAIGVSMAGEGGGAATRAIPGVVIFDPRAFVGASPALTELGPALSVAAQWWGLSAVPATVHDAWLVDGLREASGLFYQESRYGRDAAHATVNSWREYLLTRPGGSGRTPAQAGPMWLGAERLSDPKEAGSELLLAKGGYGISMLRQMMRSDRSPTPDAAFNAMLREFAAASRGRAVTTAEFQAVVEKHMTAAMDLDHNHKMDWFFQPLIYGTAVPQLSFHAVSAAPAKGIAQVTLTVENPEHWRGLLPVYLFQSDSAWVRGLMPVTHDHETLTVPVPFTPQYVEANYFGDMLVVVKQ